MSEFQQSTTHDLIQAPDIEISVTATHELAEMVNSTDENIILFDQSTTGRFGRIDSIGAIVDFDIQGFKRLFAEFSVRPEHGVESSSAIKEILALNEKLKAAAYSSEQLSLGYEQGKQNLTVFASPDQIVRIYAYVSLRTPQSVTVSASVRLVDEIGESVQYERIRAALEAVGIVAGRVASSMHPVKPLQEPLSISLADYSTPEIDENQIAIVMYFEGKQVLVEDLDSSNINTPIFCVNGKGNDLLRLATRYRNVPIEQIEIAFESYTKERYKKFQEAGVHPTITIDDIEAILVAASNS